MKKKIIAAAAAMAMLIGTTAFAYEYPQEKDESDDPMNNSLFEIVADVNSDIEFFDLSDFKILQAAGLNGIDDCDIDTDSPQVLLQNSVIMCCRFHDSGHSIYLAF